MTTAPLDPEGRLDALLREVAAARSAQLELHPDADELVDYCLGALPPPARERLEEHLSLCHDCAQAVLDLREMATQPPAGAGRPAGEPAMARDRPLSRARRTAVHDAPARTPLHTWAVAASLLIGVGLLAWNLSLRRSLDHERQPRADVALADLTPVTRGAERSLEHQPQAVVPAGVARVVLLLNLGDLRSFPRYRMALISPAGSISWKSDDARRAEDGTFVLDVPAAALAATGPYHVRIAGLGAGSAVHLADYAFVLVRTGQPSHHP